ncbi:acetyltransferase [Pseudomonas aeruginosa]|uniref:acetyltransferase n=1 Tax=Pseudomonas aeruginosa TaxID=287 RepID=UPI004046A285
MRKLAILGAGGHGKVVADTAECCGWEEVLFFDDAWPERSSNGRWEIVGGFDDLIARLPEFGGVVVAIGNNVARHAKLEALKMAGAALVVLCHPQASISRYASLGLGTVVFAGVVVNVDARIGEGVILNTGCSVDHDCVLGAAVHVSPGARIAGGVEIAEKVWIGMGACIRQLTRIGARSIVGAGAVVLEEVPESVTVVGAYGTAPLSVCCPFKKS